MVIEPRHNILPPLKINHSISQCSVFIRVSQGRHATVFPGGAARRGDRGCLAAGRGGGGLGGGRGGGVVPGDVRLQVAAHFAGVPDLPV